MASCGANSIAVDECMSLEQVGETTRYYGTGLIGNFHTTAVLFEETESSHDDAKRCINAGKSLSGYVFGLGAPITQHIRPELLEGAVALIRSHGTSA